MADWQAALLTRLRALSDVSALVQTRSYWMTRPQLDGLPAITLQVVSDPRPMHMEGFSALRSSLVQVDVWADSTNDDGHELAHDIANKLIVGLAPRVTVEGIAFDLIEVTGLRDLGEAKDDRFINRVSIDLTIWHAPA